MVNILIGKGIKSKVSVRSEEMKGSKKVIESLERYFEFVKVKLWSIYLAEKL